MTETNEEQIRMADDIEADTTTPAPILEPAPAPAGKSAKNPKSKLKLVKTATRKVAKPATKARKTIAKTKTAAKVTKTAKKAVKVASKVTKVTKAIKKAATGGQKLEKLTSARRPTLKTALRAFKPEIGAQKSAQPARRRPATTKSSALHVRTAASLTSDTLCGGSHSPIWNRSGEKPLQSVGPQQASKGTCGRCRRVAKARRLI